MAVPSSSLVGSCGCAVQGSAAMAPGPLTITAGRERLREWAPPYDGYAKSFCEECGLRPAARQFVAFAAEWEPIPDDDLPRYDGLLPWR
jgi:hypothetical protein